MTSRLAPQLPSGGEEAGLAPQLRDMALEDLLFAIGRGVQKATALGDADRVRSLNEQLADLMSRYPEAVRQATRRGQHRAAREATDCVFRSAPA